MIIVLLLFISPTKVMNFMKTKIIYCLGKDFKRDQHQKNFGVLMNNNLSELIVQTMQISENSEFGF